MRDCFQAFRLSNDAFFTLFDDDGGAGRGVVVTIAATAFFSFGKDIEEFKEVSK